MTVGVVLLLLTMGSSSAGSGVVVGLVRVQAMSPTLVRLERKGPEGFEDRPTFTVEKRPTRFEQPLISKRKGLVRLRYRNFTVVLPSNARSLKGIKVLDPRGKELYACGDRLPIYHFLPGPSDAIKAWAMADAGRIEPPKWGATPPPPGNQLFPETSGWDTGNDAPDLYVFVPGKGGYRTLRADFLTLTGSVPIPSLWSFGFWDSRYYRYTDAEALATIDAYREHGFPIDGFVVDTDWRVNGSDGYNIDETCFPDMAGFLKAAHDRHVRVMFNDHPDPQAPTALDPKELAFRWNGLDSLLKLGADAWWFDRNWHTSLVRPNLGIPKETWGMRLYHDMTLKARPDERPLIMSNFEGIDNGFRRYAPHPAGHRYPIKWTGDTIAQFAFLRRGIENAVDMGVLADDPYLNEDLGGHISTPSSELYVRFLQYGSVSPTMRVHCTMGQDRHPWSFGKAAEDIVRRFVKMRYRLAPTLYAAAFQAHQDGTPILRRCDLEWPSAREAKSSLQFMLGDDLLVAPIYEGRIPEPTGITTPFLKTPDGQPGVLGEYFANKDLQGKPAFSQVDDQIAFNWYNEAPRTGFPRENFSVRWTGKLGPVPDDGTYVINATTDDGVRGWIDGQLVIDSWFGQPAGLHETSVKLEKGHSYDLRMEYFQLGGGAEASLDWVRPTKMRENAERDFWLPKGEWVDAWSGALLRGGKPAHVISPLWQMPMFVRAGGVLVLAPASDYLAEHPWSPLTLDAFAGTKPFSRERWIYEDDGHSNEYLKGAYRRTKVRFSRSGATLKLVIEPASGRFEGMDRRDWLVRVHLPKGYVNAEQKVEVGATRDAEATFFVADASPFRLPPDAVRLSSGVLHLKYGARPLSMPFLKNECGPAGGPVLIAHIPQAPIDETTTVVVHLKRSGR